jgi:hypothetical protein
MKAGSPSTDGVFLPLRRCCLKQARKVSERDTQCATIHQFDPHRVGIEPELLCYRHNEIVRQNDILAIPQARPGLATLPRHQIRSSNPVLKPASGMNRHPDDAHDPDDRREDVNKQQNQIKPLDG